MALLDEMQEVDSLNTLEERIVQAIDLVSRLRQERDQALSEKAALTADKEAAEREAAEQIARLSQEVDLLRSERQQVRGRIEKLLTQIDALTGA